MAFEARAVVHQASRPFGQAGLGVEGDEGGRTRAREIIRTRVRETSRTNVRI